MAIEFYSRRFDDNIYAVGPFLPHGGGQIDWNDRVAPALQINHAAATPPRPFWLTEDNDFWKAADKVSGWQFAAYFEEEVGVTDWRKEVSRLLLEMIERWEPRKWGDEDLKAEAVERIEAWALEVPELLGVTDVAKELGWPKAKVSVYRDRGILPKPATHVGGRSVWTKKQIEEFKEKNEGQK